MKHWIGVALLLTLGVGCQHQCFLAEKDFKDAHLMPSAVEHDKTFGLDPVTGPVPAPPDVTFPERKPRHLTLQEAIAVSLENGTVSGRTGIGSGIVDDNPATYNGASISSQSDTVRVLALAPAIAQANIEASLSRWDARWISGLSWNHTDQLLQGLTSFNNGDRANFNTSIVKPLESGGFVHTSLDTTYQMLNNPPAGAFGVLNPSYTTRFIIGFEQPLLQNFGSDINQLLNRPPQVFGSTLPGSAATVLNQTYLATLQQQTSFVNEGTVDGVLITRLRFNLSRAEFERQINNLVLNVEVAYWKLYEAYGELYTFEEALRIVHNGWLLMNEKFGAGRTKLAELAQLRGQYEEFRGERVRALGQVLEAERNLRGLMGVPIEDGERLVPITPPTMAGYRPDWDVCLQDALNLRPELVLARESLRVSQFNLDLQKNFLKPDLRLVADYVPTGFGTRLDGNGTFLDANGQPHSSNALRSLASNHFDDWLVGLNLSVPIGYRLEHASIRAGRLALAQSYFALKDQEERIKRYLVQQYQKVSEWWVRIETARQERKNYAEAVKKRLTELREKEGVDPATLLEVHRRFSLAQQKEYQAISEYNSSLARLEFAKGTVLKHDNVVIAEGAVPYCAEVRAVDHERERAKALVLRQPAPLTEPGRMVGDHDLPATLEEPGHAPAATWPAPAPKTGEKILDSRFKPGVDPVPFDRKKVDTATPLPPDGGARSRKDAVKEPDWRSATKVEPTVDAAPKMVEPAATPDIPLVLPPGATLPKDTPLPSLPTPPSEPALPPLPPPATLPAPATLPPAPAIPAPASDPSLPAIPPLPPSPAAPSVPLSDLPPVPATPSDIITLPPAPLPGNISLPPATPILPPERKSD